MKAAVLSGTRQLEIKDVPIPEAGEGEVLINVKATAVCGTDVGIYKGEVPARLPVIQGHESVGVVAGAGPGAGDFRPGDRVIMNPAYFCGKCFYCRRGQYNLCGNGGLIGRDRDGSFAEYLVMRHTSLIRLPDSISMADATSLHAMAAILRGWERLEQTAPLEKGGIVVVIGLGAPGLLYTRMAALSGAGKVFAVTRSRWKLDIASDYGGIPVNPREEDIKKTILDATGGRGADLVVECAGNGRAFNQAIDLARPGGTVLSFGILHGLEGFDAYNLYYKELNIIGTRAMNTGGYRRAVALVDGGAFDLKPLITHSFSLDETEKFFKLTETDGGSALRMVCVHP